MWRKTRYYMNYSAKYHVRMTSYPAKLLILSDASPGFLGNSNNLHRIIVDDFTDSMHYLLMVGSTSRTACTTCSW